MVDRNIISPADVIEVNPMYMLRWEEQQGGYVLLYPEGIVKLNSSAAEILKLCDGARAAEDIVDELKSLFGAGDIDADIYEFLEAANDKGWIRPKA